MRRTAGRTTQKNSRAMAIGAAEVPGVRPTKAARITATCATPQMSAAITKRNSVTDNGCKRDQMLM